MSDHKEVNKNISKLESMVPGILSFGKPDWKSIWQQVKITGNSFKGSKFPSKDEREDAWTRFQKLVEDIKEVQAEDQKKWEKKKEKSAQIRNMILAKADAARPVDTDIANLILTLATGGVNLLLETIMGPFDEEKDHLKSCSKQLQKGWDMLRENKEEMLGKDKGVAFDELNKTKEILDRRWESYKIERQRAYDNYQQIQANKRQAWKDKIESNIKNLEERREKLSHVLSHKEQHLSELYEKLRDAWSDDFRSRVSDWIEEEKSNIRDIEQKLRNIEDWIYENRDQLRS